MTNLRESIKNFYHSNYLIPLFSQKSRDSRVFFLRVTFGRRSEDQANFCRATLESFSRNVHPPTPPSFYLHPPLNQRESRNSL